MRCARRAAVPIMRPFSGFVSNDPDYLRDVEIKKYWRDMFKNHEDVFTLDDVNENLYEFQDQLLDAPDADSNEMQRILVPCCGKDLSMCWLAERPNTLAMGVDITDEPLRQFANEQLGGMKPLLEFPHMSVYQARRYPRLILLHADFLKLSLEDFDDHPFDAIWDRAAITSIPVDQRLKYAQQLRSLVRDPEPGKPGSGGRLLLEILANDDKENNVMGIEDTKELLESCDFDVRIVKRKDVKDEYFETLPPGITFLDEVVFLCIAKERRTIEGTLH